ncbi:hypothetical protein MKX01_021600 [Papaver californicum]|nr:hypothetical protein MKX01_021600 [Papaver californicum]
MRHRGNNKVIILAYTFIFFFIAGLRLGSAVVVGTTITQTQFITDPQTIVSSQDGIFRLGFFSLGDSRSRYVGVWYNNIPGPTIVWVANRDHPLNDSTGVLKIATDGNLVVLDGQGKLCWTSNVTGIVSDYLVAELLDTGNIVLRESSPNYNHNEGRYFWQSFDQPTNTFLPDMQIGVNIRTGDFTFELDPYGSSQLIVKNGAQKKWRSGPGVERENFARSEVTEFVGMNHLSSNFKLERDYSKGTVFVSLLYYEKAALSRIVLDCDGKLVEKQWNEEAKEWKISWSSEIYNKCGPFGIYNQDSQTCSCMRGSEPKYINEWKYGNWSGGCARTKDLQCEKISSKTGDRSSERTKVKEADGFLEVDMSNVPDYYHSTQGIDYKQCHYNCLRNCSCIAYLYRDYDPKIGCMWWTGELIDALETSEHWGGFELHVRVANSELEWFCILLLPLFDRKNEERHEKECRMGKKEEIQKKEEEKQEKFIGVLGRRRL